MLKRIVHNVSRIFQTKSVCRVLGIMQGTRAAVPAFANAHPPRRFAKNFKVCPRFTHVKRTRGLSPFLLPFYPNCISSKILL